MPSPSSRSWRDSSPSDETFFSPGDGGPAIYLKWETDDPSIYSWTDTGLSATKLYKYTLVVHNHYDSSDPYEITVQPSILPGRPISPQLTGAETVSGTLVLMLQPPVGYDATGRSNILFYELRRNDGLGGTADITLQGLRTGPDKHVVGSAGELVWENAILRGGMSRATRFAGGREGEYQRAMEEETWQRVPFRHHW